MSEQRAGSELSFGTHSSWGFCMAVDIRRNRLAGPVASARRHAEGMIGILLTQRMMDSPESPKVFTDFWTLAYVAME